MAIHFDALAKDLPSQGFVIPAGTYVGTIESAEMKVSKTTGKDYLNVLWQVTNKETGKSAGKLYDNFTESDNAYVQNKLYHFITALKINLGNTFELKDLAKVLKGMSCYITISVDEKTNPEQPKSQINIFDHPYEAIEENIMPAPEAFNVSENEDLPFEEKNAEPVSDENY